MLHTSSIKQHFFFWPKETEAYTQSTKKEHKSFVYHTPQDLYLAPDSDLSLWLKATVAIPCSREVHVQMP